MTTEAYQGVIDERIHELLTYRRFYRAQRNRAHWSPLRLETEAELRALVRLARRARKAARVETTYDRWNDTTTWRVGRYDGWTEPELREAFGK